VRLHGTLVLVGALAMTAMTYALSPTQEHTVADTMIGQSCVRPSGVQPSNSAAYTTASYTMCHTGTVSLAQLEWIHPQTQRGLAMLAQLVVSIEFVAPLILMGLVVLWARWHVHLGKLTRAFVVSRAKVQLVEWLVLCLCLWLGGFAGDTLQTRINACLFAWLLAGVGNAAWCILQWYVLCKKQPDTAKASSQTLPGVAALADKVIALRDDIARGASRQLTGATRTIGLFGEWGMGKTTFLRQLEATLNQQSGENGVPQVAVVFYDAWKWQAFGSPEATLLDELFNNRIVHRHAWFLKPLRLRISRLMRSLRISLRGFEVAHADTKDSYLKHYEMSVLTDAYKKLFDALRENCVMVAILIDEADRCERQYFQSLLALLPRYLNADNCCVVCALVYSQLTDTLFTPIEEAERTTAQQSQQTAPNATGDGHADASLSSAAASGEANPNNVPRYDPDLLDCLRTAYRQSSSRDDVRVMILHKFFEEFFFAPQIEQADVIQLLRTCLAEWGIVHVVDDNCWYAGDIANLCRKETGLAGNARLIVAAFKTTLALLKELVPPDDDLLRHADKFWKLFRIAFGCHVVLQRYNRFIGQDDDYNNLFAEFIIGIEESPGQRHGSRIETESQEQSDINKALLQAQMQPPFSSFDWRQSTLRDLLFGQSSLMNDLLSFAKDEKNRALFDRYCRVWFCSKRIMLQKCREDDVETQLREAEYRLMRRRFDEGLELINHIITILQSKHGYRVNLQLAKAMLRKCDTLRLLDKDQEAVNACDDMMVRFGNTTDIEMRRQVAIALLKKSSFLEKLDPSLTLPTKTEEKK